MHIIYKELLQVVKIHSVAIAQQCVKRGNNETGDRSQESEFRRTEVRSQKQGLKSNKH